MTDDEESATSWKIDTFVARVDVNSLELPISLQDKDILTSSKVEPSLLGRMSTWVADNIIDELSWNCMMIIILFATDIRMDKSKSCIAGVVRCSMLPRE